MMSLEASSLSSSVQLLSRVRLFATPWTAARQASLSITNSQSLLRLMSIESGMPSNHLILCHPLLLLPSIFQSSVFSHKSVLCGGFSCCRAWVQYLWCTGPVALQHVGSSGPRNRTCVLCISRQILNHWTTSEVLGFDFKHSDLHGSNSGDTFATSINQKRIHLSGLFLAASLLKTSLGSSPQ